MKRLQKVRLLEQIEAGVIRIEDLKEKSVIMLYKPDVDDLFCVQGSPKCMTQKEVYDYTKNKDVILSFSCPKRMGIDLVLITPKG